MICSDVTSVPLARAAAASSAVPLVMSPVTINNYGGTCNYRLPAWAGQLARAPDAPKSPTRIDQRVKEVEAYGDSPRAPYIHLVDGGVSDNLACAAFWIFSTPMNSCACWDSPRHWTRREGLSSWS